MLDDANVLKQRDPGGMLTQAADQYHALSWQPVIEHGDNDGRALDAIVICGMGGSALAANIIARVLRASSPRPIEVVRTYDLPAYVGESTLVLVDSHSGNTEETLSCYDQARQRGAQIGVIASGGTLLSRAAGDSVVAVTVPSGGQPRMATIYHLKALLCLMEHFGCVSGAYTRELEQSGQWLKDESTAWHADVPIQENYAKQFALLTVGKTPVFYGGPLTAPLAYKLKISWNENAKNIAFWNEYPEFNHNEFIGWSSHPIEKPFAIVDLYSNYEPTRIAERMVLSDRLLSGKRPHAVELHLRGDSPLAEAVWACVFADFASTYVAILNNVNPEPVALVEKLKTELAALSDTA